MSAHPHHRGGPAVARGGHAQKSERTQQSINSGFDHHARHQRRYVARRGGMRLRQPDVQRHEAGLRAEPDDRQQKQNVSQTACLNAFLRPNSEIHRAGFARQSKGRTPAERPCPDALPQNKSSPPPARIRVHARTSPGRTTPAPSIPRQSETARHCAPAGRASCPAPAGSRKTKPGQVSGDPATTANNPRHKSPKAPKAASVGKRNHAESGSSSMKNSPKGTDQGTRTGSTEPPDNT